MTADFLFDVRGKKALVTGGSVGLGRAFATALAMAGADVAIAAIDDALGERTTTALRALGVQSFFVRCDVSNPAQVDSMVASVAERFGRLDIAVNNAGVGTSADEDTVLPKADWDRMMRVNLNGVWLCALAEARQMSQQTPTEGKIINIASICGVVSIPMSNGAYDASKAAVIHLTRQLAIQWGRFNINVNCISPGYVLTRTLASTSLEFRRRVRELTPMGHMQRPEDLYGPVLYLASKASDYMTGQNLVIDGGHTLGPWFEPARPRAVPPRVGVEEEIKALKADLDALGIPYNENGVAQS